MLRTEIAEFLGKLTRRPRICLVKQEIYKDLYNIGPGALAQDILLSSNMRTGPAGLLSAFECDFRIVRVAQAPECQIWHQKITDCRHGDVQSHLSNAKRSFRQIDGSLRTQGNFSTDPEKVDWGTYDIVISYDISIPTELCRSFPKVLWAYYITEGCMKEFRDSLIRPIEGYDLYLNHHFREDFQINEPLHGVKAGAHVLEFPYFIQYYQCFSDILNRSIPDEQRAGVVLDPRTKTLLNDKQLKQLEAIGPVARIGGNVWHVLESLLSSKYYIRLGDKAVLGNSSIEAIAGGTLFVGTRHGIKNSSLLTKETTLPHGAFSDEQFASLMRSLSELEANQVLVASLRAEQRRRLDEYCFFRPVRSLLEHWLRRVELTTPPRVALPPASAPAPMPSPASPNRPPTPPKDAGHQADLRLLQRANQSQREGRHEEALRQYRELLYRVPLLRPLIAPEIDRASRNLHMQRKGLPVAPTAGTEHAVALPEPAHQAFCHHSLAAYLKEHPRAGDLPTGGGTLPLVSVVMTAYNAEDTVQEAVESMLNQDWPHLEVWVCDDCSTDNTWEILSAMARRCKPLRVMRLNANYGTYLAKNTALRQATGEFVVFQDSDDVSHPARVRMQVLPLLANDKLMATRTKYLRYREDTNAIVRVAGRESKYGLITVAVRRSAFREIGYFDAVRKAGDDEWVQRLLHVYGEKSMKSLDLTLYAARLRENSLVADMMVFNDDGSVEQKASKSRWDYVTLFKARHAAEPRDYYGPSRFPPFPLRPQKSYPADVAALPMVQEKVFAAVCSIPQREKALLSTLGSLMHQVDRVYLYLDNYERPPEYLQSLRRVVVLRSQDHPGLRDNGKFLMYNEVLTEQRGAPFYWFTCDDDIIYPSDYVHTMLQHLAHYERRAVVGLHGVVVDEMPRRYFRHRYVYHYEHSTLRHPRLVNNLGTGTVAFHSALFGSIDPYAWPQGGMLDIFFSVTCARQGIPMVCVPRHAGWLKTLSETEDTPNLIGEFRNDDSAIVEVLRANGPWGLARMRSTIAAFEGELRARLEAAMPAFANDVSVRFDNYRNYLPGQPG